MSEPLGTLTQRREVAEPQGLRTITFESDLCTIKIFALKFFRLMFLIQALKKKFTLAENTLDIAGVLVIIRLVRSKSSFKFRLL